MLILGPTPRDAAPSPPDSAVNKLDTMLPNRVANAVATAEAPTASSAVSTSKLKAVLGPFPPVPPPSARVWIRMCAGRAC
jgi:hypothetical protein